MQKTLAEMEFTEGMALIIELKDAADEEPEEAPVKKEDDKDEAEKPAEKEENVNDTPNLRTVLACHEDAPSDTKTLIVDILKMSVKDLTAFLVKELEVKGAHRVRKLFDNKLFNKEDEDTLLATFPGFEEGGTRLSLEAGNYCSFAEVAVKVKIQPKKEDKDKFNTEDYKFFHF